MGGCLLLSSFGLGFLGLGVFLHLLLRAALLLVNPFVMVVGGFHVHALDEATRRFVPHASSHVVAVLLVLALLPDVGPLPLGGAKSFGVSATLILGGLFVLGIAATFVDLSLEVRHECGESDHLLSARIQFCPGPLHEKLL